MANDGRRRFWPIPVPNTNFGTMDGRRIATVGPAPDELLDRPSLVAAFSGVDQISGPRVEETHGSAPGRASGDLFTARMKFDRDEGAISLDAKDRSLRRDVEDAEPGHG